MSRILTSFTPTLLLFLFSPHMYAQISFSKLTSHPLSTMTTTIESASNGGGAWITGDFDGDGDSDIMGRVAADNALAYWRNDGTTWTSLTGTSNPFRNISFPANASSFHLYNSAAFDIDGDGDIDVFNGNLNEVYQNDEGTFTKITSHPLSSMTTTIESASSGAGAWISGDFDGDGDVDIVGRVAADNALAYWRNDGSTWTSLTGTSNPFNNITFAANANSFHHNNSAAFDIDGDGDIDVYNGNLNEVYQNDNGTFSRLTSHPLSSMTTTIENASNGSGSWIFGDFDGDGDIDIVGRVAADNALAYWRNDGTTWTSLTGTSNPLNNITFTANANSFHHNNSAAFDIDGDGDMDIFNGNLNEVYLASGVAPKLLSSTPSHLATDVTPGSNMVLTFDEPITTGAGNIYIRNYLNNSIVQTIPANGALVTGSGTTTITIDPATDLTAGGDYYITFDKNALADADGVIVGRISTIRKMRVPETTPGFLRFSVTGTLPVTLRNFSVSLVNEKALLQWQTASEQNSLDFAIQRSTDNRSWTTIGTLAAAGNSTQLLKYQFSDPQPQAGVNQYRLMQRDLDGQINISNIQTLTINKLAGVHLYPNPATDVIKVRLLQSGKATIAIYTALGQEIFRSEKSGGDISVPLTGRAKGLYRVVVIQNGQHFVEAFYVE